MESAQTLLQRCIDHDTNSLEAHLLMARLSLHQGHVKQCSSSLELALSRNFEVTTSYVTARAVSVLFTATRVVYNFTCASPTYERQTALPIALPETYLHVTGWLVTVVLNTILKSLICACSVHPTLYSYVRSRATHCTTWSRHRWRGRRGQLKMLSCRCRLP